MRPRVDWMTNADDRILEFFEENRLALPPAVVNYHLDYSTVHINNRMRKLTEHGLLKKVDEKRAFYEITDRGLAYLDGKIDAEDLE